MERAVVAVSSRNPDTFLDWVWVVLAYGFAALVVVLPVVVAAVVAARLVERSRRAR